MASKKPTFGDSRGPGRPRNDEIISPLAHRPNPGERVPTIVTREAYEVLMEFARRWYMPVGTCARVILHAAAEVGPKGVLDFKALADRLEEDRNRLMAARKKAMGFE